MTSQQFKTHILPCYDMMFAVVTRIVNNNDDAADIIQEVIRSLWERHENITLPDIPKAFCCTVARNAAINHMRFRQRHPLTTIDIIPDTPDDDDDTTKERLNLLQQAIEQLPNPRGTLIKLSLDGYSTSQIALKTGYTEANVRQIISRGRQQLKSILSKSPNL